MKTKRRNEGFTLIEIMVATLLSMLLIGAAYYLFLSQHRALQAATNFSSGNQSSRLTLEQLSRELRMANFGVINAQAFTVANKYAMTFSGDVQSNIVQNLAANANAGATSIQLNLVQGHAIINPGDYVFLNGGGNVEMVPVAASGTIIDYSTTPATVKLAAGLQNSYTAAQTLVRTVETVSYVAAFPTGVLTRNGVTLGDRIGNLEFHYYNETNTEMVPDPVNGLNETDRAAIRRVVLIVQAGGPMKNSPDYTLSVDLRNMGNRPYNATTCAPNPPTGLTMTNNSTCGQFGIGWTPPTTESCNGAPLTNLAGFKVYYGTSSGNYLLPPYTVSPETLTTATVQDVRLNNNQTYYVAMTAYDTSYNESAKSSEISITINDTTPPGAPSGDAAAGPNEVTLTWTPPNAPDVRGFRIYRSTSSPVPVNSANEIANETTLTTGTTTYTDTTNLIACTEYHYVITAVDCANEGTPSPEIYGNGAAAGTDSPTNGVTNTTPTKSPATPPAVPSPFNAVGRYQGVDLYWTNSPDADFAGVEIRYSTTGYPTTTTSGTLAAQITGAPNAPMQTSVTGLTNGVKYYFSIFAYDQCNIYSSAAEANATPGAAPPVVQITSPANGATITNGQIVFQAAAYAADDPGLSNPPNMTNDDGKGILNVKLWAAPDPGTAQFPVTANVVQYCGFGGTANPCNAGPATGWCDGSYALNATATDSFTGQTATTYVTVTVHDGGLYDDTSVSATVGGTYANQGSFGLKNDSASSSVIVQTLQFTWNNPQAALKTIEIPSGTVIWTYTGTPAVSGTLITLPTNVQPSIPGNGKASIRLTFTQNATTLTSSATSGSKALQTASGTAFATGNTVYITSGTTGETNVVASVSGNTVNLTNPLTHTYASGSTVRFRLNADDVDIHDLQVSAVYGYQKSSITGRSCTSSLAQLTFMAAPAITFAEQDYPGTDTYCSPVTAAIQVLNYFPVPTHVVVTDENGAGIAAVDALYYVDTSFQSVAPTSGYTTLAMTSQSGTWDATIPGSHNARIWLYFTSRDNTGATDRSPEAGSYTYDYIVNTTPPACPAGLTATKGSGNGTIDLSWTANSEPDIASYNIYRETKGSGGFSKLASGVTPTKPTVSYVDTNGLATNKNCYDYYVTAVDMSGNESTGCSGDIAGAGKGTCP
jgi:type II secretory pathway pseudopilin PulG